MVRQEVSPARHAAFHILRQIALEKGDPASLLHSPRWRELPRTDHELATEIVYGVLRWQNRLDYNVEAHSQRPLAEIDLPLLIALRMGVYQIRYLRGVPSRASVDESVKLARVHGRPGAHGFVNAVLRSICRSPDEPPDPKSAKDPLGFLTITLSHPEWLARRYLSRLGLQQAEARFRRHNHPPPIDLRVEPPMSVEAACAALAEEGVVAEVFPMVPRCLRVRSGKVVGGLLHRSHAVFIQEAGSQLVPYLLDLKPGDRVLDACAAPGAKATEMAHWTRPGPVVALELRPHRLAVMAGLSKLLGCDNLLPVGGDAGRPPFHEPFSRILLDAPCSSLGTLTRNPDIKWRLEENELQTHAGEQLGLLNSCADLLASGGRLVYSTCSTEPEETEEVVGHFLSRHPGFRIAPPPDSFPRQARDLFSEDGALRTFPERDDMDGYYAVILEKMN